MNEIMSTNHCSAFQYNFDENIALSIVFALCFFLGVSILFVGYRFFRISLFIQTFSVVSFLVYLVLNEKSHLSIVFNAAIASGSGVIVGILGTLVRTIGLLWCSLIQSIFISSSILFAVHLFTITESIFIGPGIVLFCFIVLSIPILKWERSTSIIYFASYGTILIMLSIDYYLDLSMLRYAAFENMLALTKKTRPCWFSWCLLGVWPVLLFLGSVVQFLKTGRDSDHKQSSFFCARRYSEPKVRLLSNKSDIIATAWMQTSATPTPSQERKHATAPNITGEDDVFLVEKTV